MNVADVAIAAGTLLSGVGALAAWRHSRAAGRELRPNGGSSFRDEVTGLRRDLQLHAQSDLQAQEQVTARLAGLEEYTHDRWHRLENQLGALSVLSHLLKQHLEGSSGSER